VCPDDVLLHGFCANPFCSGEQPINKGMDTYHIMGILIKAEVKEACYQSSINNLIQ
jgi:hypothetical protein